MTSTTNQPKGRTGIAGISLAFVIRLGLALAAMAATAGISLTLAAPASAATTERSKTINCYPGDNTTIPLRLVSTGTFTYDTTNHDLIRPHVGKVVEQKRVDSSTGSKWVDTGWATTGFIAPQVDGSTIPNTLTSWSGSTATSHSRTYALSGWWSKSARAMTFIFRGDGGGAADLTTCVINDSQVPY